MARPITTKLICIVEDDEAVRDSLSELLSSHSFEVRSYGSALGFLAEDERHATDCACLILDLHMPGMTGLELLELLRARRHSVPTVVITGRGDNGIRERAARSGVLALLEKPVDETALLELIAFASQKHTEMHP